MNEVMNISPAVEESTATGETSRTKARRWPGMSVVGALFIVLALLPLGISGSYYMHVLILTFVYVAIASSWRVVSISGQFNIAIGAFMGIGAYAAAIPSVWLHWPPWVTIPLGAVAATILGAALAFPFARLRTIYYAMGTLFLGYVVINLITAGGKTTGMSTGLGGVQPLFGDRRYYYYLTLGLMIVSMFSMYRFEFSRIGVRMKAVSQSHQVAASVGIGERRNRILAVAFGSFFAGLMGAVYCHYQGVASPSSYGLGATLWIIMYVLVGGINSFWGPAVGVGILMVIPEFFFRDLKGDLPYVTAAILLIIAFTMPEGIVGLLKLARDRVFARLRRKEVDLDASGG
ncbi:MAG: branched-chain amino acid ABC transporter permease [Actinobacteria bacterium]|jgi:branched-chain amino acid transport system permease protein|nr:branched-chain amino acid ABC transporter permease [Actinomycetota bacterium]